MTLDWSLLSLGQNKAKLPPNCRTGPVRAGRGPQAMRVRRCAPTMRYYC